MKNRSQLATGIAVAVAIFFTASLSISKSSKSGSYYKKFQADAPPSKQASTNQTGTGSGTTTPSNAVAGGIHCKPGGVKIGTYYNQETRWGDTYSTLSVKELKDGQTDTLACTLVNPPLINEYNKAVNEGSITVVCKAGALSVQGSTCKGPDDSAEREAARIAAEQAAAAEAARIAEEKRKADEAAAAAAAAQAAAQAAAAAPCPQNCGGGMGTYTGGSNSKNQSQWKVTYQQCNSGHKIVRSSGKPSSYAVGACYNNIP